MHTPSLAVALTALAAFAQALPNQVRAAPPPPLETDFPTPKDDPFYHVPKNITKYKNGDVIRARTVLSTEFSAAVDARQVFYRTTNRAGKATGTVTTIFIPPNPASPPEILSYQSPEDALNIRCAPSWANVNITSPQETYLVSQLTPVAQTGLQAGQYVINSDDEGEDSEWLVGITEGRATLDGIRATINDLGLSKATKIGLLGYSGGAHESVWASSLAASYAPELNIIAAAYGGTPVDLQLNYNLLNGGSQAALAGGAIAGLANGYPKFKRTLDRLMTKKGKRTFALINGADACLVENGTAFAGYNFSSPEFFTSDPQTNPVIAKIISEGSLLSNVSPLPVPVPKFARYEWHGTNDTTVPYGPEIEYIDQQCRKGANIAFTPYPGLDHTDAFVAGLPGALTFLEEAFSGTLQKVKCGSNVTITS